MTENVQQFIRKIKENITHDSQIHTLNALLGYFDVTERAEQWENLQ